MSPILLGRDIREQFPGTKDKAFLDAACVSLAPLAATEAIQEFLDLALSCPAESSSAQHLKMDEMRRACVPEAARLLRVDPEEIALVESTTHGLNIAATSFPLPPGSTVLIPDLEFLQVAIPWACQRDRGIRLKAVPHRSGRVTVEDFAAAWDSTVRAVVTSSVQWCNGYRVDLESLGRLCRERGALFIVDAIQQMGAVDIDLRGSNVDIMVAGGHKWLNAPFGAGILYVRRELLGAPAVFLTPPLFGPVPADSVTYHYGAVSRAVSIDIMVQDASVSVPPAQLVRLAQMFPNVRYAKEEAPDSGHRISEMKRLRPELKVLSGGSYLLDDLARGAQGAIPGSVGMADLSTAYDRYMAGDLDGARAAFDHFTPLSFWRRQFGLLGAKEVLRRLGIFKVARLREPVNQRLDEQDLRELTIIMERMGPPY